MSDEKKKDPAPEQLRMLRIGDTVAIGGMDCRLVHTNPGKRRMTFEPTDSRCYVPSPLRDPVIGVKR